MTGQKMSEKEKNRQIRKEAIVSIILYAAFFIWWYFTGYGIAEKGTTETYTYVFGLREAKSLTGPKQRQRPRQPRQLKPRSLLRKAVR